MSWYPQWLGSRTPWIPKSMNAQVPYVIGLVHWALCICKICIHGYRGPTVFTYIFPLLLLWCLLQKYSLKLGIRTCHSFCLWFLHFVSMLRIKITTNFIGHQSISCAHSHWILTTLWIDVLTSFHRWWVGNFS